jgi:hypothetical protein
VELKNLISFLFHKYVVIVIPINKENIKIRKNNSIEKRMSVKKYIKLKVTMVIPPPKKNSP